MYSFYVILGFIMTISFKYTTYLNHIHPILSLFSCIPTGFLVSVYFTSVYLLGCASINMPSIFPSLADFTYGGIDYACIIVQSILLSSCKAETPFLLNNSIFPFTAPLAATIAISVTGNLTALGTSCIWSHTEFVLRLAYFT